jgi:hypothetical protein
MDQYGGQQNPAGQSAAGYAALNDQNRRAVGGALTKNPDTLENRLEQIGSVLADCEGHLHSIATKIHGATPETAKNLSERPSGISSWTMDLNTRAQRLRDELTQLNQFLA